MFNKNDFNINFGDEEGKSLCPADLDPCSLIMQ